MGSTPAAEEGLPLVTVLTVLYDRDCLICASGAEPHIRQSRPDHGRGFQVKILGTFEVVAAGVQRLRFIFVY